MKPRLLVLIAMGQGRLATLREHFDLLYAPDAATRAATVAHDGAGVQVVLTNGTTGLTAAEIDAMPALTLACAFGAGYEGIAVAHALARGVALANGAGTNDDCVADHAMALLLATVRAIPQQDRACREGVWRDALPLRPQLAGKRLGVLGLGAIGRKIARRAEGFGMPVGYHSRSRLADVPYAYLDGPQALARWCDALVVATPGGAATRHLVDAHVLQALGPAGYLVNVARGSVVDTGALAAALRAGAIAGAGLDVYEGEPAPPAALLGFDNVVVTPHVAGWSPESNEGAVQCFLENARRHWAGEALLTPVVG
jgi:D-3-phosphoglycerate dehydrogenase